MRPSPCALAFILAALAAPAAARADGRPAPAEPLLLVRDGEHLWLRTDGAWKEMTGLAGLATDGKSFPSAFDRVDGRRFFWTYDDARFQLADLVAGTSREILLPAGKGFRHGVALAADGALWWSLQQRTTAPLSRTSGDRHAVIVSGPGRGQYQVRPAAGGEGQILYTSNPGLGGNESSFYVDLVFGSPETLHWLSKPGAAPKALARHDCIRAPRFVDEGRVAFWRNGAIDEQAGTKTWVLATVGTAADKGAAKEQDVATLTFPKLQQRQEPFMLASGDGLLAWPGDWTGDLDRPSTTVAVLDAATGARRTVGAQGGPRILLPPAHHTAGHHVVFYDDAGKRFTVADLRATEPVAVPADYAKGARPVWALVLE
jgi:hypothetical protein